MTRSYDIRAETPGDFAAISDLHRDAFGHDEPIPDLVHRLRHLDAPLPTASFVAEAASEAASGAASGAVIGHVMLSHGWLDAPQQMIDILVLSPLGIAKAAQGNGIGTALLAHAAAAARRTPAPILFLEGNPAYYGPRGFEPSKPCGIRSPSLRIPEPALQMLRLPAYRPEMTGTLVYRDLWWELDCVGLR